MLFLLEVQLDISAGAICYYTVLNMREIFVEK